MRIVAPFTEHLPVQYHDIYGGLLRLLRCRRPVIAALPASGSV